MDEQLVATVSMLRANAQGQLGVLQFYWAVAATRTTNTIDDSQRKLRQSIMQLAHGCHLMRVPEAHCALECYALVSRQPYSNMFASGRSATEYVLQIGLRVAELLSGRPPANLLRPGGPTDQELESLVGAMPVFLEAMRNSGSLPDLNFCARLRSEIEWEAVKALDRAQMLESGVRNNRPQEKREHRPRLKGTKPDKFKDRDDEIERLADEELPGGKRRSAGDIFLLIKGRWPVMENKKPLNAKAVATALRRRRESRLRRNHGTG